jgi:hypothetical protein
MSKPERWRAFTAAFGGRMRRIDPYDGAVAAHGLGVRPLSLRFADPVAFALVMPMKLVLVGAGDQRFLRAFRRRLDSLSEKVDEDQ